MSSYNTRWSICFRHSFAAIAVVLTVVAVVITAARAGFADEQQQSPDPWKICAERGRIYDECGQAASRLLEGWLDLQQDEETFLFSRYKVWDYHNEAADHYSSLVMIAHYVAPRHIAPGGLLYKTLINAQKLCASPDGIPVTYDLRTQVIPKRKPLKQATYGQLSEWLRDGLIRIAENMGTNTPWYDEMVRLTDAMIAEAENRGGMAHACRGAETSGNMLQTLARLSVMSGDDKYLLAAEKIADPLLLEGKIDPQDVNFIDHGCELVPGLAELFVVECKLNRPKAAQYRPAMQKLLDSILENAAHPTTGMFMDKRPDTRFRFPDTWGYVMFAYENYDRATGEDRYRAAIQKPIRWLLENRKNYQKYRDTLWPTSRSADDWSDSYESLIILSKCYPEFGDTFAWLDWATLQHIQRKRYGPYTGGHHDGSSGRNLCTHMMLCSQGVRQLPFQENMQIGGLQQDGKLLLRVESEQPYSGRLYFDGPRNEYPAGTLDWARINEMPQWFVVRPERKYVVTIGDQQPSTVTGQKLIDGLPIQLKAGQTLKITVKDT